MKFGQRVWRLARRGRVAIRVWREKKQRKKEQKKPQFPKAPAFEKQFPALAHFLANESHFFPNLDAFRRQVSDAQWPHHATGTPRLIGDLALDNQLVQLCNQMQAVSKKNTETLVSIGHAKQTAHADQLLSESLKNEKQLNAFKMQARKLLLGAVWKFQPKFNQNPRAFSKPKYSDLKPVDAVRLFLSEEANWFPRLFKFRVALGSLEHATPEEKKTLLHQQPPGTVDTREQKRTGLNVHAPAFAPIPRLTGDFNRDQEIARDCIRIFEFRDRIREQVIKANLSKSDPHTVENHLYQAMQIEEQIDEAKKRVRGELVRLQLKKRGPRPIPFS